MMEMLLVKGMLEKRRPGLTKVSTVKGHVDEESVTSRQIRALDKMVNDQDDDAADHGTRIVPEGVIDARRHLSGVVCVVFGIRLFGVCIVVFHGKGEGCR